MATPGVASPPQPLPQGRVNGLFAVAVAVVALGYFGLVVSFFPNPHGRLGIDYEYFLPLLLAGKYWIAENGFLAVPRFTPAFCGGLPLLANPQSLFYSLPQVLSLVLDPVTSVVVTTLVFAALGGIGTFMLMRMRFAASVEAATLAAVIFLCNGFLLHRMVIGHVTYHVVALVPLLCHVLLTPLPRASPARYRRAAGPIATAAAMLAYVTYAGAPNILVPLAIAVAVIWLLHALLRGPVASFWWLGAGAALLAAAVSAAKLAPALAFLAQFPRPYGVLIFDNPVALLYGLFLGLFLPSELPDLLVFVMRHEMELGVGLVPLFFVIGGMLVAIRRHRPMRWFLRLDRRCAALLAALVLLLGLPLWLNYGDAEHAALLKSLPYIGDNVLLVRWFFIYLLPLALAAGLLLDAMFAAAQRSTIALAGIALTAFTAIVFENRAYYDGQPYAPQTILAADQRLDATGAAPPITRIASTVQGRGNDGMASGASGIPCYEPIFGYRLETFPPGLSAGPILSGTGDVRHLRNPACYIYGRANGCAPGDTFSAAQHQEEASFAAYQRFDYVLPLWQRWADGTSIAGIAMIMIGFALAWRGRARQGHVTNDGRAA